MPTVSQSLFSVRIKLIRKRIAHDRQLRNRKNQEMGCARCEKLCKYAKSRTFIFIDTCYAKSCQRFRIWFRLLGTLYIQPAFSWLGTWWNGVSVGNSSWYSKTHWVTEKWKNAFMNLCMFGKIRISNAKSSWIVFLATCSRRDVSFVKFSSIRFGTISNFSFGKHHQFKLGNQSQV